MIDHDSNVWLIALHLHKIWLLVKTCLIHHWTLGTAALGLLKGWLPSSELRGSVGRVGNRGLMRLVGMLVQTCLAIMIAFVSNKAQLLDLLLWQDSLEGGLLAGLETAMVDKLRLLLPLHAWRALSIHGDVVRRNVACTSLDDLGYRGERTG